MYKKTTFWMGLLLFLAGFAFAGPGDLAPDNNTALYKLMPDASQWVDSLMDKMGKLNLSTHMANLGTTIALVFMFGGIIHGVISRNTNTMMLSLFRGLTALMFISCCFSFSGFKITNNQSIAELQISMWNSAFERGKKNIPSDLDDQIIDVQTRVAQAVGGIFVVKGLATFGFKAASSVGTQFITKAGQQAKLKSTQALGKELETTLFNFLRLNLLLFLPLNMAFTLVIYGAAVLVAVGSLMLPLMIAMIARGDSRWLLGWFSTFLAAIIVTYSAPILYQWSLELAYIKPLTALAQENEKKEAEVLQRFSNFLDVGQDVDDLQNKFNGTPMDLFNLEKWFKDKAKEALSIVGDALKWVWGVIINWFLGCFVIMLGITVSIQVLHFTVRTIYSICNSSVSFGPAGPGANSTKELI